MRRHCWKIATKRKFSGTVLLMALLILSQVIVTSIGLGTLIINSLQQSRFIDNSLVAYYAAESGAEDALYELRHNHKLPKKVIHPATFDNGASWTREVAPTEPSLAVDILKDSFIELDLFDPEKVGSPLPPQDAPAAVRLTWPESNCIPGTCPYLVASDVSWNPTDFTAWDDGSSSVQRISAVSGTTILPLSPDRLNRLRLRAEGGDFKGLVIDAFNSEGNPVGIPGRVVLDLWGRFGDAVQHLLVKVPREAPMSSVYDFAIFSECSLVKGRPIRCP